MQAKVATAARERERGCSKIYERPRLITGDRGRKMRIRSVERQRSWLESERDWREAGRGSGPPRSRKVEASTRALLQLNILQTVVFSDHKVSPRGEQHTQCARS